MGGTHAELAISHAVAAAIGRPSTVVHSGLDARARSAASRDSILLVAQRLQPEKQTGVGVEAFARSGLAAAGWRLWIAGIGQERDRLDEIARREGIADSVRFLGDVPDVPGLMDQCGILLAPCPVEGLGLTVLEAMQSGLPVVAARAGGHVELLDGLDPRALFSPGDADAAAEAPRELAADGPGRAVLGAQEHDRQQADYTIDAQLRGTDAVYRAAIASRSRRD